MFSNQDNPINYFAETNFRNKRHLFGIFLCDRLHHLYILGRTGTGKTTLLQTKIKQDITQKRGVCLIDVHGDLVLKVLKDIPKGREKDVVYLDATNPNLKLGYNPLRKVSYEKRSLITSNILEIFQKLWGTQGFGVKMSHILRNVLLALLDQPQTTFTDIIKILQDSDFRNQCIPNIINQEVKTFWEKEFKTYGKVDLIPIYNKLGGILSYPSVKRILVDNKKQISLRRLMDNRKILLVNLSKGAIGTEASYILGSLLLTSLSAAAFSRIDMNENKRPIFFIYLDEFQNYTNLTLVEMLSELRKFKVGMIMAHQYISQLDPKIRDAVLNNVGSIVCFRLGQADAKFMEREFYPIFQSSDFVNLANYDIYLKLMISGSPSKAFSATTILPNRA
jgi:type IV secretory pathway VirB4 component